MDSLAVETSTTTCFCTLCFNVNSLHFIFQLTWLKLCNAIKLCQHLLKLIYGKKL